MTALAVMGSLPSVSPELRARIRVGAVAGVLGTIGYDVARMPDVRVCAGVTLRAAVRLRAVCASLVYLQFDILGAVIAILGAVIAGELGQHLQHLPQQQVHQLLMTSQPWQPPGAGQRTNSHVRRLNPVVCPTRQPPRFGCAAEQVLSRSRRSVDQSVPQINVQAGASSYVQP
jgi:hypothetical protein